MISAMASFGWISTSRSKRNGGKKIACVDVQQTRDVEFWPHIFRVLTMDGSVPVDSRVFIQTFALRKSRVDSGITDVAKPGGRP